MYSDYEIDRKAEWQNVISDDPHSFFFQSCILCRLNKPDRGHAVCCYHLLTRKIVTSVGRWGQHWGFEPDIGKNEIGLKLCLRMLTTNYFYSVA